MQVTSKYTAALVLPNGQTVPAQGSVDVDADDWKGMKDHPVVKGWFDDGHLSTGKAAADEKSDKKA